jgi:hypothetical protein
MECGIGAGGQGTKPNIKKLITGLSGCEWESGAIMIAKMI